MSMRYFTGELSALKWDECDPYSKAEKPTPEDLFASTTHPLHKMVTLPC